MSSQKVANNPLGSYPVAITRRASDNAELQIVTSGLCIPDYDSVVLSYTGENLTGVVYSLDAVTVATLTLSYTGSNLTSVVKS